MARKKRDDRHKSDGERERERIEANRVTANVAFAVCRISPWESRPVNLLLGPVIGQFELVTKPGSLFGAVSGYGAVDIPSGVIYLNPAAPGNITFDGWTHVLVHLAAHLGFGHHLIAADRAMAAAMEIAAESFARAIGIGAPPAAHPAPVSDDLGLLRTAEVLRERPFPSNAELTMAGHGLRDHSFAPDGPSFAAAFGQGLEAIIAARIDALRPTGAIERTGLAAEAKRHIMNHSPLLAALAGKATLITDPATVNGLGIAMGAANAWRGEIYLRLPPGATLREVVFIYAHELLHLGLRHGDRRGARDRLIWNYATDFVINGWLVAMGVGSMPRNGLLFDPKLSGLSAEAIYDLLISDRRRTRRLATLGGVGIGDIIDDGPGRIVRGDVTMLDDIWVRALRRGLDAHMRGMRGLLPAGLVEAIEALDVAPVPWDVQLAHWFEEFVREAVPVRTYARASRRQSASPDIPRPHWYTPERAIAQSTFGVVLDTSGSMDHKLLAKALGAISSYAGNRGVRRLRLVYCDAAPYDEGWIDPETLRRQTAVKGRGGTVLQEAIDMLDAVADFPDDAPVLVLTDGGFEADLRITRTHAFVIPKDASLPSRYIDGAPVFGVL
jgi:predicted metal-dependent peptidase